MSIKINGTTLTLQPTEHGWIPKTKLGESGNAHAFYAAVQEYELRWDLSDAGALNQLFTLFDAIGTTGTAVVELPQYGGATYNFVEYSGTVLDEPQVGVYYSEHTQSITWLIRNIRTG